MKHKTFWWTALKAVLVAVTATVIVWIPWGVFDNVLNAAGAMRVARADTVTGRKFLTIVGTIQTPDGPAVWNTNGTTDATWGLKVHGRDEYTAPEMKVTSGGGTLFPGRPYVRGHRATVAWWISTGGKSKTLNPDHHIEEINADTRSVKSYMMSGTGVVYTGTTRTLAIPADWGVDKFFLD